nr:MAG TPA: hypothetical protein [Bacteriophage sp.]
MYFILYYIKHYLSNQKISTFLDICVESLGNGLTIIALSSSFGPTQDAAVSEDVYECGELAI